MMEAFHFTQDNGNRQVTTSALAIVQIMSETTMETSAEALLEPASAADSYTEPAGEIVADVLQVSIERVAGVDAHEQHLREEKPVLRSPRGAIECDRK